MATQETKANPSLGPLERLLSLFTEVRKGEGLTTVLLALNVFLLLTSYYIIKPVREALILAGGGAEVKSYASAGQALLLLGAVPAYAALASRVGRRQLITGVTLFFAACLPAFYIWGKNPGAALAIGSFQLTVGVAFFLWVGVFNLMVPAQFWSFANDLYTPEAGKRLFAIVAFGASAGAVSGSVIAGTLIARLGVEPMLLVAALLLLATLLLTLAIDSRERRRAGGGATVGNAGRPSAGAASPASEVAGPPSASSAATPPLTARANSTSEEPLPPGGAFRLVWSNRYLLLIALLMLFLNWVNTNGEYILGRVVKSNAELAIPAGLLDEAARQNFVKTYVGKFYSDFFSVVNVVGLLAQLFLVSRILKWFGVRVAILVLPMIALGGYAVLAFAPILSVVRWAKTAENATDYSLQNTVRQTLFLPTTREQKYKAKQAIDTFFVRAGDLLSAGVVLLGTQMLHFQTSHFALVNLGLVAVWAILALLIGRENERLTRGAVA